MRILLTIYILTITTFCYGQNLELVNTESESFYKVLNDSIDINRKYPDGRYKIFMTDTNSLPTYVFNLIDGKVEGPYLKLTSFNWTYGNYSQDSLWTFLTNPEDTTFKIGTWRHHIGQGFITEDVYKMPFDTNGKFKEVWNYYNGQKVREATFRKAFGIEKETYYDFETTKVSKQTINSGTKNYYQSIVYKNDSISYVSLIQNGIEIIINFDYMPYFCENRPCTEVSVYTDNWERNVIPMASMSIDSSKTLIDMEDIKRQIFFSEDEDGNIRIRYPNKNGKIKHKKLKIR